jgi:thiamine biosynthesis protein ThiS
MANPPQATITIILNGEPQPAAPSLTLFALLVHLEEPIDKAIVEYNGRYVRRLDLDNILIADGDRIEVILPAFGG